MLLNRTLHRYADKKAVQRIIEQVTSPYVGVAEAHFARAQAAQAANEAGTAIEEIDRALALRPDWEQAALMRAQLLFPRGAGEVTAYLSQFVAANPKALEARLIYARALVSERRYTDARREFAELLAAHPDNGDVIYAMAVLSIQLNELAEAETHLKRLVEIDYPEINAARLYLGQIAEDTQRWGEALKWFGQVAPGDQYLAARLRMAHVLAKQGMLDDARRHLQETAAGSPKERIQLLVGEAQLLREAGRPADAFAVLDAGLATQPDQVDLLYETALAAERAGQPEVMERHLRRLIELRPDHAHAYNALGYSLADRNLRLDEAAQLVDKALELAPEDPYILDSRGWVLFRQGDSAGAAEVLKKAFGLRADPEIAAHLGEVLWALGRRDEAIDIWDKAAKASPGNETLTATIKRFKP
jgi:tetratricopeptide (TPR) repeat protein